MSARNSSVWRWLALLALGVVALPLYMRLLAVAGLLANSADLFTLPELGALAVAVAAAAIVLASRPAATRRQRIIELALLLGVGVAFRAVFVAATPTLSHDAYRYVWDAHLLANGVSPWAHTLSDPVLAPLRDNAIWPQVNWRGSPTIYPPGAQLAFLLVNAVAPLSIGAMKWAMTLCDFAAGALTLVLLRQRGQDLRRVVIYWWNPLPILEFTFTAHVDALATVWTLAALVVLARDTRHIRAARATRSVSGALLGLAAATKLYPLLFAASLLRPVFPTATVNPTTSANRNRLPLSRGEQAPSVAGLHLRPARRRQARDGRGQGVRSLRTLLADPILLALGATVALVYLPFTFVGLGNGGFLATYFGQRFVDQGILFRLITTIFVAAPLQLAVQALALVALCGLVAWLRIRRALDPSAGVLAISAIWIVLSPHLFPWYVAGLLPLLALHLRPIPLSYFATFLKAARAKLYRRRLAGESLFESRGVDQAPVQVAGTVYPLALYLFVLAMPFTYVIFAPGHDAGLFVWFFYIPLAIAAAPWIVHVIVRLRRRFSPTQPYPGPYGASQATPDKVPDVGALPAAPAAGRYHSPTLATTAHTALVPPQE